MQVEEHGQRLLGDARQRLEGAHGVPLPLVQGAAVRVHPAARDAPGHEGPPDGAQGPQVAEETLLLVGEHRERRVARAEVVAEPLRERTQHGHLLVNGHGFGGRAGGTAAATPS